ILNIYKKEYKLLLKFILNFLVGFLILLIPLLIYFLINNSLLEMIYQSLIININYSGDAPIGLKDVIFWIIGVANDYSLVLIILLSTLYYYKNSKNMVLIGIVLLAFCILLSIISKRTYLHYLIVLIPLFIPYISILLETLFDKINYRLSLVIICCFIVTSYFPSLINIKSQIQERNVDNSRDIAELANYIKNNSNEDDRIYGHR
ncbi:hypothetical protein HZY83_08195, partial [Gemella sp. GH3]|uniref:hypothetical protein n=1 Tax=unclassified Gemella TaxID=2624949 RepID=UPI0015D015ED